MTTRQIVILTIAEVAEFFWMVLPGWAAMISATLFGPIDGALGKQYGLFLGLALGISVTMLWGPTAQRISMPLIKKLARRIGVTSKKEE